MDEIPKSISDIQEPEEIEVLETIKDITDLRQKVLRHYDKFLNDVSNKRIKLEDSRRYQLFLLEADELEAWLNEKLKQLQDFPSLKNRVQEHRAFETVINNHAKVVQNVEDNGMAMISERHFASHKIRLRLDEIQRLWELLRQKINNEELALRKLYDQLVRDIEHEEAWIREKEPFVASANRGRDYFGVRNLIKKHDSLMQEIKNYEPNIEAINKRCDEMIGASLFGDLVEPKRQALNTNWKNLLLKADQRRGKLEDSLQAHQYLADAAEAEFWMREKEPIIGSEDLGKDEDSTEALLKKHEALMSDLVAFNSTIQNLNNQAASCRLKELSVSDGSSKEMVLVLSDHDPKSPREISVRKGETITLLNALHNEWWKVEVNDRQGFVPASCLRRVDSRSSQQNLNETYNIPNRQRQIEELYNSLLELGKLRLAKLEDSIKAYQVVREAADLTQWIKDKEQFAQVETVGDDLEQVEVLQKKFDDFEKDMKDNQVRLKEMNNVAEHLKSIGQADAANKIAQQIDNLNQKWNQLEKVAQKRRDQLGSAHEVQRFQREAEDTRDWIAEKDKMLDSDDYGNDLRSVLALQRKHEGLESDLYALNERIKQLNETAERLRQSDPRSAGALFATQDEINQEWDKIVDKSNARKVKLVDSHNLQRLLADQRDMKSWIDSTLSQVRSNETAPDVTGAEALMDRHQEVRAEIDVRKPKLQKLEIYGKLFIDKKHYASPLIEEKLKELKKVHQELIDTWEAREDLLKQNLALALYYRDCEQAENWMGNREAFINQSSEETSSDSVEGLIKKHEDFDKALSSQENKINNLKSNAEGLIASGHYAAPQIRDKCQQVLDRWARLKDAMIEMRSRLNESQTLQQFSRDADEVESWIQEKQATALGSSVRDATNIQAKNQKHQALEAELKANEERIKTVLESGRKLIDSKQCGDTENAVLERLNTIDKQYQNLTTVTSEKSFVLKEASQLRSYNAAVKDIDFWLEEVESLLKPEDTGNDLATVQHLLKQHQLTEADVKAHEDRIKDMNNLADSLIQSGQFDSDSVQGKRQSINERYERLVNLAAYRRNKLNEKSTLHQFLRDIIDEESWIKEKKLLVSSDDYGRDLAGVQNLRKKHKRLEADLAAHNPNIKAVQDAGQKLMVESNVGAPEIEQRLQNLEQNWLDLQNMATVRNQKLMESQEYQEFLCRIDEEEAWIREKHQLMTAPGPNDSMAAVQGLLKKHDAMESEFENHRDRINDLNQEGKKLIDKGNHHRDGIQGRLELLKGGSNDLQEKNKRRRASLLEVSNTLQFKWQADVVDSWINDKFDELERSDITGRDLLSVKTLLGKQERFDACLDAFEHEGIAKLTDLKNQSTPIKSDTVNERYDRVLKRWNDLRGASEARKASLDRMQDQFKQIEEHFLTFAKRASAFNSWFENAEEDLTDPVRCNSIEEARALREAHTQFQESLAAAQGDFDYLKELDQRIRDFNVGPNPYTWFTMGALDETWNRLKVIVKKRDSELIKEAKRQEENDWLRKQYAKKANSLHEWIKDTRMWLLAGAQTDKASLEEQLEANIKKMNEVRSRREDLKTIEELGKLQETELILDNRYTEHSTTSLAQQWDQLEQLGLRMQHNLEQQIQARNQSGVSEDALREFSIMFKYFDKDNSGRLNHSEFKNCLRALGYDLPMVEENQLDPEFEAILNSVDPNRDGQVSLQEYMAFLISRETENVQSSEDIEQAFRAITLNGDRAYVTSDELFSNLRREVAQFCVSHMEPYDTVPNAYDYTNFTRRIFV